MMEIVRMFNNCFFSSYLSHDLNDSSTSPVLTRYCRAAVAAGWLASFSLLPGFLFSLLRLGECEQDHGELLLGDLAVAVEVAPLHDRLLKVLQVVRVVHDKHPLDVLSGQLG